MLLLPWLRCLLSTIVNIAYKRTTFHSDRVKRSHSPTICSHSAIRNPSKRSLFSNDICNNNLQLMEAISESAAVANRSPPAQCPQELASIPIRRKMVNFISRHGVRIYINEHAIPAAHRCHSIFNKTRRFHHIISNARNIPISLHHRLSSESLRIHIIME